MTPDPSVQPWSTRSLLLCALLMSACQQESTPQLTEPTDRVNSAQTDTASDLSSDALTAPSQAQLGIRAEPASLIFDWSPIAEQRIARLYRHDTALPGEILVYESDDTQVHSLRLPSNTPQTPWHRLQYRLELCTSDDCVSSERMSLSGLAPATAHYLSPAVFLQGERYAEHIAVNRDASLAIVSLPLEGSLELHTRSDTQWSLTQRLRLETLPVSASRSIHLSSSDTGNTIAVFITDSASARPAELRILERLGETWVQTQSWPLDSDETGSSSDESNPNQLTNNDSEPQHSLLLAAEGNGILLQSEQRLYTVQRTKLGWTSPRQLIVTSDDNTSHSADSPMRLSSTANSSFTQILTLTQQGGRNYLSQWSPEGLSSWQQTAHLPLSGFSADSELALQINAEGDVLLIAGWEDSNASERHPIMWRYSVNQGSGIAPLSEAISLEPSSSLRAPPTTQTQARLVFSADERLCQVMLGWQLAEDSVNDTLPDAAISTWQIHAIPQQWMSALELPEAIPMLAKQDFSRSTALSADGSTLMMAIAARPANTSGISEILVLR